MYAPENLHVQDRIVITGVGMIASVGDDRESVWSAVRHGASGARSLVGVPAIPDHLLIGAAVDVEPNLPHALKVVLLCQRAADEALRDASLETIPTDRDRFGCAISGHMGDLRWLEGSGDRINWHEQWLPNSACHHVARRLGLDGPRICHSTACASGLIDILSAIRAIRDDQCDIALAGSGEAIHPLFAAGFYRMGVLARHEDPRQACRPFNLDRDGFIMGEGAAMFVVERLEHAVRRGAAIYAEVLAGAACADARHVTGLDAESDSLTHLIEETLRRARLSPSDIGYVNAHGTGTVQNDAMESRAIRRAFGPLADRVPVSSNKARLGHLVNAASSVEMAITTLALRDGFIPPTMNLTQPDPECDLDFVPLVGRKLEFEHALKHSVAFGGHMAAIALRRWNEPGSERTPQPLP
jgi:3-oxoacyl-(acyl-carrier-protein) synthase